MSNNNRKRALVLGGLGLIGGSLAVELTKEFDVFIVDKKRPEVKIKGITYYTTNALDISELGKLITKIKPGLIVNAINIATIFSNDPEANYSKIVRFYFGLYKVFGKMTNKITYLQMGTTGSGGLGFNIPFTHGDNIEDLPIINKAAFAGITDAMLTLMSRTFGSRVKVAEIKPGLAIFRPGIVHEKFNKSNLVIIDGGESGFYTYNELALLTCHMGFTTVDTIVDKIFRVLNGGKNFHNHCVYDTIGSLNGAIIKENHLDHWRLTRTLKTMKKFSGKDYIIATGKLGPSSITRDLILSHIKKLNPDLDLNDFNAFVLRDNSVVDTLAYIKEHDIELHTYLVSEINFSNYQKFVCNDAEPWQNTNNILSQASVPVAD